MVKFRIAVTFLVAVTTYGILSYVYSPRDTDTRELKEAAEASVAKDYIATKIADAKAQGRDMACFHTAKDSSGEVVQVWVVSCTPPLGEGGIGHKAPTLVYVFPEGDK